LFIAIMEVRLSLIGNVSVSLSAITLRIVLKVPDYYIRAQLAL
jgi:hypothetical protein